MKVVFLSNYFNHHQKYISDEFYKLCKMYKFVSTSTMREERKVLGYGEKFIPEYVMEYRVGEGHDIFDIIKNCDFVVWGSAPEKMVRKRICENRLVFKYSERPLKSGDNFLKYIPRLLRWHSRYPSRKNIYMLCASAYTAYDYKKYGVFCNRTYKWGYFPETKKYDLRNLFKEKVNNKILWCGRFVSWKHPEVAIKLIEKLRKNNYPVELIFIGTGVLEDKLKQMVAEKGLSDYIYFLGPMKPQDVRVYMERVGIYLFTSDRQEGWGAVLNEAMNSGCAVVASHAIGAVPYLIKNEENGVVYKNGDIEMLFEKVKYLLDNPKEQERLGKAAYETIVNTWNAEEASKRLLNLAKHILDGEESPDLYKSGPCSKAEIIKDNWFYG